MNTAARSDRKPCPYSGCARLIPLSWTTCRDRNCPRGFTAVVASLLAARRDRIDNRLKNIRRENAAEMRRIVALNEVDRRSRWAAARAKAEGELLDLINEQDKDRDYIIRLDSDPWMMRSLDAPVYGAADRATLADLLSGSAGDLAWQDPTAEAALALLDAAGW